MALHAVDRTSLADRVFEQLTREILEGRYAPGDALPAERSLSEVLGVNRHVVREALTRLEQAGLVRVVQGGRTTVLDPRESGGLDLLVLLARHAPTGSAAGPLLAAVMEMRAGMGAEAAGLCAERADEATRQGLLELAEDLAAARTGQELLEGDERFWRLVVDGSGNLAYQLAFNSLLRAVHANIDLSLDRLREELARGDHRRPIAAAIGARDPQRAAQAARDALMPVPERPRNRKRRQEGR